MPLRFVFDCHEISAQRGPGRKLRLRFSILQLVELLHWAGCDNEPFLKRVDGAPSLGCHHSLIKRWLRDRMSEKLHLRRRNSYSNLDFDGAHVTAVFALQPVVVRNSKHHAGTKRMAVDRGNRRDRQLHRSNEAGHPQDDTLQAVDLTRLLEA